jgi:cobyric acid synthase CobQ/L-threonine-O-3-phosphate decarboxylase
MNQFPHGGDVRGLAAALGCAPSEITDFSASINPLGPPEWLRPVISSAVSELVHYPDPDCREFIAAAAKRHGVPQDRLIAGNGTSELLFALTRAAKYRRGLVPVPSYCDYQTACQRAGMEVTLLPFREENGFALSPEALSRALGELNGPAMAFIARPNNPTGLDVPARVVRELAAAHPGCLFVVDEAFGTFVTGFETLMRDRPDNVAVLASLTKMFAIPGLRLGLACAGPELILAMRREIAPWSVNTLAQAVGTRAVADPDFEALSSRTAALLRRELARGLAALPGVAVYPGQANYLLCRLESPEVPALRAALLEKRIAIRDCSNFAGLDGRFFRVAVRRGEDNARLLEALTAVLAPRRAQQARPTHAPDTPHPVRRRTTPALMVQGTTSNAGKSVIAAALCRILLQDGVRVAPFKSQNMSLNSCVTAWGEEMGRAQALQAAACGLPPQARMNPVLLKPCSDTGSQVIVMGKPVGNMRVREYVAYKPTAFEAARKAYDSLASEFDAVILEGAGSPAEVNLKSHDMVNMAMAAYANSRVLLVGDIDRGGVFAALAGTMELLSESERALVGGFVLNRFRGDPTLLDPAHRFMLELTGKPVLGVVPEITDLGLPEEDSVSFKDRGFTGGSWGDSPERGPGDLDIAVLDLPHISNFTDCDALAREPDVTLRVVRRPEDLGHPDAVILPGSKNTLADLARLRETGLAEALVDLAAGVAQDVDRKGCEVVGICAGLQMLGERIADPTGLESDRGLEWGLGLLPLTTELMPEKTLRKSTARHLPTGFQLTGYEIHHGITLPLRDVSQSPVLAVRTDGPHGSDAAAGRNGQDEDDGRAVAWGRPGRVWGTYLHGVFDEDGFRRWWLNSLRAGKGLPPLAVEAGQGQGRVLDRALDRALDRLADTVRRSLDMEAVYALLRL